MSMVDLFPHDSAARKEYPVYSGLLQYFPSALAAIAHHSFKGNDKHNPGQPLHHDRAKSGDEADALVRHLMEGDYVGMAWRALSLLQKHLESHGAPIAPAARNATITTPPSIDTSEKHVEFLTNGEHDGTNRTQWRCEPNIKPHRRVVTEAERNAYLDSFSANPPNCDGNRPVMMAEADRLAGEGE